jgi:hypothetical protein
MLKTLQKSESSKSKFKDFLPKLKVLIKSSEAKKKKSKSTEKNTLT